MELKYEFQDIRQKATEIANNSLDKIIYGVLSAKNNETVTITVTDNEQSFVVGEDIFNTIYARRIERRLERQERRLKHKASKNQF